MGEKKGPPKLTNLTLMRFAHGHVTPLCHYIFINLYVCVCCVWLSILCLFVGVFARVPPYLLSPNNSQVPFSLTPLLGSQGPAQSLSTYHSISWPQEDGSCGSSWFQIIIPSFHPKPKVVLHKNITSCSNASLWLRLMGCSIWLP